MDLSIWDIRELLDMIISAYVTIFTKPTHQHIKKLAKQTIDFHGRAKFRAMELAPQKVCLGILFDENNLGIFHSTLSS